MTRIRLMAFVGTCLAQLIWSSASGQYMYLDANGNGVHDAGDILSVADSTTVDVWLWTDRNRDGTYPTCEQDSTALLTINSYVINLAAAGGTVAFSNFINQQSAMDAVGSPERATSVEFSRGQVGFETLPPGLYRLCTLTIKVTGGSPEIDIEAYSSLAVDPTSFGSACPGADYDNTLKRDSDWFDADGLPAEFPTNTAPTADVPSSVSGEVGAELTITGWFSDPDAGQELRILQVGMPQFLSPSDSVGASPLTITLRGTPSLGDEGDQTITWVAIDDGSPPCSTLASTTVSIVGSPLRPLVQAPSEVAGSADAPLSFTVSATAPPGTPIETFQISSMPNGAVFVPAGGMSGGTITWTPEPTDTMTRTVIFEATNAAGTGRATTMVKAIPCNEPRRTWVAPELRGLSVGDARSERYLLRPDDGRVLVSAFATGEADPAALLACGAEAQHIGGRLMTIACPVDQFPAFVSASGLDSILAPTFCHVLLDSSASDVNVDGLRTLPSQGGGQGAPFGGTTGKGALIGIVDTGIDVTSEDFFAADGTTRILRYFDMSRNKVWTPGDIVGNAATVANLSPDACGHGTHVAGIAAGSGRGGTACVDDRRYVGIAPDASLCVVKVLRNCGDEVLDTTISNAVNYIFAVADSMNMPCVVNLSVGSYYGAHDGTSNLDVAMTDAVGPGRVIVAGAGNAGLLREHAALHPHPFYPESTVSVRIPSSYVPSPGANNDLVSLHAWWSENESFAMFVEPPNGVLYGPVAFSPDGSTNYLTLETDYGALDVAIDFETKFSPDHDVYMRLSDADAAHPPQGDAVPWKFHFNRLSSGEDAQVDVYIEEWKLGNGAYGDTLGGQYGLVAGRVPYGVVTSPASADSVIGVGAYSSRTCWVKSYNSRVVCGSHAAALGGVADFSSRGPRRDGVHKPDIIAPGDPVISTKSAQTFPDTTRDVLGGRHIALSGTSQASPHVAGAVALLLSQPGWRYAPTAQVLGRLTGTARHDGFTGTMVPNDSSGYGKLDVAAALSPISSLHVRYPDRSTVVRYAAHIESVTVFLGGESPADSIVVDLARDTCRTYDLRLGKIFNVPAGQQRSVYYLNADTLSTSFGKVRATAYLGGTSVGAASDGYFVIGTNPTPTDVAIDGSATPKFEMAQNKPNPFNPVTTIELEVVTAGKALIKVYSVDGRLVRTLLDREVSAGRHVLAWDGTDGHGIRLGSGIYFCEAVADGHRITRKMALIR